MKGAKELTYKKEINDFSLINLSSDLESEQHNEKIDQLDQLSKISQA